MPGTSHTLFLLILTKSYEISFIITPILPFAGTNLERLNNLLKCLLIIKVELKFTHGLSFDYILPLTVCLQIVFSAFSPLQSLNGQTGLPAVSWIHNGFSHPKTLVNTPFHTAIHFPLLYPYTQPSQRSSCMHSVNTELMSITKTKIKCYF